MRALFARVETGLVVADAACRVIAANEVARRWLQSDAGICERNGQLRGGNSHDADVRRLVRSVGEPRAMRVAGPGRRGYLEILAIPDAAPGRVLLVLMRSRADVRIAPGVLRGLFGLTRREAEIAAAISAGYSTVEVASDLSVQPNTVRVHLKTIYGKTGTRDRVELVAKLCSGVCFFSAYSRG